MPPNTKGPIYKFHDNCEKKAYVVWINRNLFSNNFACVHLPINPSSDDLFDDTGDGIIYCFLIHALFPNSLDTSLIEVTHESLDLSRMEKLKNIHLAYETARSMGCNVKYLRVYDIFCGVRQSVIEFLWQIFYVGMVNSINYQQYPEIIYLKDNDEMMDTLRCMKPLETLIRYVNYRIAKFYPQGPFIKSIDDELSDGKIYAYLASALSQENGIQLSFGLNAILNEKNDLNKIQMLIDNLAELNIQDFILDELFKSHCSQISNSKIHLLIIAEMFKKFRLPHNSKKSECGGDQSTLSSESILEKLCRAFMNFCGVKPICTNIILDNQNSLLIIQLLERFHKDMFAKDKIYYEFSGDLAISQKIHNANKMLKKFEKYYSLNVNELYAESIVTGHSKVICGIIYNLILYWAMNGFDTDEKDGSNGSTTLFDKSELLLWVNSYSKVKVNSFRDLHIIKEDLILKVIDKLYPENVNWDNYNALGRLVDKSTYILSVGRKQGCPLFMTPDMLSTGDHYTIMLIFTILKYRSHTHTKMSKELQILCP